ncbi:MAG: hypothetical protein R3E44_03225 [Paracoccaceae bacterium]
MTFHAVTAGEVADIAAFLRRHLDWAMFPLSNLVNYGFGRDNPYQMRFWLLGEGDGIQAALGLSGQGMLLPVLPDLAASDLTVLFAASDAAAHAYRAIGFRPNGTVAMILMAEPQKVGA